MKLFKKIILSLGIIFLVPFLIAFFVKKDYSLEKYILINKPKYEVFEYIRYLKNGNEYSEWNKIDPKRQEEFRGEDGKVGAIYYWNSNNEKAGEGEQEIINIIEGERMDLQISFKKPFKANDNIYFITENISENETKITRGFKGKISYPINIILLFMDFENMMGFTMQKSLDNLKEILENSSNSMNIK